MWEIKMSPSWMVAFPRMLTGILSEKILRQVLRDWHQGWKESYLLDEGSWQSPGLEPLWGGREFIDLLSQGWDPWLGEKSPLQAEEQSQVSFHCSRPNGPAGEMVQKRRRKALQKPLSKGTRGAGCR